MRTDAESPGVVVPEHPTSTDPQLSNEYAKARYNALLEIAKEQDKARLATEKARLDASIGRDKGDRDAEIALAKADADAQIVRDKAERDAEIALAKADADAAIALNKARVDANLVAEAAGREVENHLQQAFHENLAEVAKASLERARSAAELVQKAAGAIVTIYTGLLALAFSVTDKPLPARGTIPALFLGLTIALSTAYVGYLTRAKDTAGPRPHSSARLYQLRRTATFIIWIRKSVLNRAYWLRASVISLGFGVLFLPLPFLNLSSGLTILGTILALLVVFGAPLLIGHFGDDKDSASGIPVVEDQGPAPAARGS